MTTPPEVGQELPVDAISIARLHGEACIQCGSTAPPLAAAGHVGTRNGNGGVLSWPVVACLEHQGVAS